MTTVKSSDLDGKLEKKEEENYDLIEISLHIGLLMVLQCAVWRRLSQGGVHPSKCIYSLQVVE